MQIEDRTVVVPTPEEMLRVKGLESGDDVLISGFGKFTIDAKPMPPA